jgi:hypothetical protein
MLACLQCAMKAVLAGDEPPFFDETPEAHMERCHPDPYATYRERQMLEQQLYERGLLPADTETRH